MAVTDDIKARVDIVDVIADYVPDLKRSGRNYHARCPFHQEKTPSFVVFPERQTWRCFGACAQGGDVFNFVQKIESSDFPTAMRKLAEIAGVAIPDRTPRTNTPRNPLLTVNDSALRFFRNSLQVDKGSLARAYVEQRGMSEETVVRWGIGYAPATGDELLKHLVSLGYSEEQALGAGIANRPEFGEVRDMLRGRLTFALRDSNGDVVAFAGRSLDGANPKYLNTPQTSLFDKSSMLYGLDRARDAIAREGVAVVVEGYMDVITAHEHGYQNVVASMGTALTENQVAQLRARAPRVVLALDADAAGQQAMLHSLRTSWQLMGGEMQEARGRTRSDMKLRSADLDALRIALIVDGKDPDELIRNDASKWRDLVSEAIPVVDFLLKAETERIDIGTSEGKAEAVELLMPVIFAIPNWVEQDRYFQKLAGLLQVPIATLEASVGRKSTVAKPRKQSQGQPVRDKAAAVFRAADHDVLDEHAIALLAQYPEILARVGDMSLELMKRPDNRALLSAIQETGTIEGAHVLLESADSTRLDRLAAKALPTADRKQRTADWEACLRRMNERYLRELKAQEEIALADQADDASPADSGYIDAVHKQAIETNERLRDLFVSGPSAS